MRFPRSNHARPENARSTLAAMGFLLPWLIGFFSLVIYPFASTLYWSFCRYDMLSEPTWVGWDNYARLWSELQSGDGFGKALWNTAYYAMVSVPLSIVIGVGLALMLSWKVRGQSVYRTLVFIPSIVPVVAGATLWVWLLDPQDGMVNHLLEPFGAQQNWFRSANEAVPLAEIDDSIARFWSRAPPTAAARPDRTSPACARTRPRRSTPPTSAPSR